MLKLILIAPIVLVAIVLILAAFKPNVFSVTRSVNIKAPPEKIFPFINDFHNMQTWSAWEKIDPTMKRTYSGATSGVGAQYAWEGNKNIGAGSMEITDSSPSKIRMNLNFTAPMSANNKVEFTLTPNGENTTVTQLMYGPAPYIHKLCSLAFSMDKMVGTKVEEGLASLKAVAEG